MFRPCGRLQRMRSRRSRTVPAALAVLLCLALTACGGGSEEEEAAGELGAAEPAEAPEPSETPAGDVVDVAPLPQGIVYDPTTDLLAVAVHDPYRLLVLDPTSLGVRESVELPGKVRHLQVSDGGGTVLVPSETANQLIEVSLPDGEARVTDVQEHPHDAAGTTNGDVVVGNEFSGSFSVVRDGEVLENVEVLEQPGAVIAAGDTVAFVDVGEFSLSAYDLRTRERTGLVEAGEGPTHGVLLSGNRVAVTDTRGGKVLLYDLDPLELVGEIDLGNSPYGVVSDPSTDLLWVTLTASNELVGLDVSGDTPEVVETYPTPRQPDTVAVEPGSETLWVTGTADGTVQRITR